MSFLTASFDNLTEDILLNQWGEDMSKRNSIRPADRIRSCIGVAMLLDDQKNFYSNDDVRFLIGADYPAGQFPGSKSFNRHEANMFSLIKPEFERFGVPEVDAAKAERSFNLRFKPFDVRRSKPRKGQKTYTIKASHDVVNSVTENRLLAAANLVSDEMTFWARHAVDIKGKPFRKPWADQSNDDFKYRFRDAESAFPVAMAGYPLDKANEVFFPATESPTHPQVDCPSCHARHSVTDIKNRRFVDSGDFVGTCPSCGDERKYHLDDAIPSKSRRNFTFEFKSGFCDSVADGLPVYAPFDAVYRGQSSQPDEYGLVRHTFEALGRPGAISVRTLPGTKVDFQVGQELEEETLICRALPKSQNLARWKKQKPSLRWATLHKVVPRRNLIPALQRQWFDFQGVHVDEEPNHVFWPMSLVYQSVRAMPAEKLYWDVRPCAEFFAEDADVNAVILPPIRTRYRDDLQFSVNHIAFSAEVADRRYRHSPVRRRANAGT